MLCNADDNVQVLMRTTGIHALCNRLTVVPTSLLINCLVRPTHEMEAAILMIAEILANRFKEECAHVHKSVTSDCWHKIALYTLAFDWSLSWALQKIAIYRKVWRPPRENRRVKNAKINQTKTNCFSLSTVIIHSTSDSQVSTSQWSSYPPFSSIHVRRSSIQVPCHETCLTIFDGDLVGDGDLIALRGMLSKCPLAWGKAVFEVRRELVDLASFSGLFFSQLSNSARYGFVLVRLEDGVVSIECTIGDDARLARFGVDFAAPCVSLPFGVIRRPDIVRCIKKVRKLTYLFFWSILTDLELREFFLFQKVFLPMTLEIVELHCLLAMVQM